MKNCIILHLHYQDYWPMFWEYLKDIVNENTDLFVTVNNTETEFYEDIKSKATEVFILENKGMDFGPFLYVLDKIRDKNYLTVTKLHGKKGKYSGEFNSPKTWTQKLIIPLIETEDVYNKNINKFKENLNLFLIGYNTCYRNDHYDMWISEENHSSFDQLNNILNLQNLDVYSFVAGSVFTVSKKYLDLLLKGKELEIYNKMNFTYANNGTLAHGLERYIGSYVKYYGGETLLL